LVAAGAADTFGDAAAAPNVSGGFSTLTELVVEISDFGLLLANELGV
jgi:hypothetical protein